MRFKCQNESELFLQEAIALSEDIRALEENKNDAIIHSELLREQPYLISNFF